MLFFLAKMHTSIYWLVLLFYLTVCIYVICFLLAIVDGIAYVGVPVRETSWMFIKTFVNFMC